MAWTMRNDVTALVATLDAERDALLAGAHERLSRLAERKERLLKAVARSSGPARAQSIEAEVLPRLIRNRALLLAAGAGVRAAMEALADSEEGTDLHTYHADGARRAADAPSARLERRA